jgi:hypothetical protein
MITSPQLARLIAGVISVLQASNLRNRVYSQAQRIEQLELAIEDIERINRASSHPNLLIAGICANSTKKDPRVL